MITRPFLLHALSPLHAGTGQAADIIDLPTARYEATGIPFVPSSSIKGALHDAIRLLQGRLSSRKVYEIASTLARLPEPGETSEPGWARLLALEVRRSLARVEGGALSPERVGLALDGGADYPALHAHVSAWVTRMLIARTFAQAAPRERRRGEEVAA